MLEIERRFTAFYGSGLTAYLALQRALMRHFVAQGGTEAEFCERLAPVFRERHGRLLDENHRRQR